LATREDSMAIVRAVAGLGRSLGIVTTAEGVENAEQLDLLRREGCNQAQGYLFSPPRPAAEVERMLSGAPAAAVA
jgi:EAL domain-containing protein (putative c-di-GMP-specific phosphodiesterase class I)